MRRDETYLLDILIAANKALKFVERMDRNEFEDNEIIQNDFGAVWDTIHKDLPKLIEVIEPLVPKEDEI